MKFLNTRGTAAVAILPPQNIVMYIDELNLRDSKLPAAISADGFAAINCAESSNHSPSGKHLAHRRAPERMPIWNSGTYQPRQGKKSESRAPRFRLGFETCSAAKLNSA